MTKHSKVTVADDLAGLSVNDLADHIVHRYHDKHREQLPELVALASKVERVHHDVAAAPRGLAEALKRLRIELESHMQKEEQVLFPAMRHGVTDMIRQPISVMRHEHDHHGATLSEIDRLTNGFEVPEGACGSWQRLYAGLSELSDDIREHIAIENELLFPRFELDRQ
jgi:regulator of cell morphogenesis and NO signaling